MISQKSVFIECDPGILPKDPVADRIKDQEHPLWVKMCRWCGFSPPITVVGGSELRTPRSGYPGNLEAPPHEAEKGRTWYGGEWEQKGGMMEDLSEAKRMKSKLQKKTKKSRHLQRGCTEGQGHLTHSYWNG